MKSYLFVFRPKQAKNTLKKISCQTYRGLQICDSLVR